MALPIRPPPATIASYDFMPAFYRIQVGNYAAG
jgi:hypothetical protein